MNTMIDILTDTPQTKPMQIACRVKQRRTTLRMTQAALAMRADIPLPTYRVFEKSGKISLIGLLKIGMALNCLEDFDRLFANQEYASLDDMLNAQTATKQLIKK